MVYIAAITRNRETDLWMDGSDKANIKEILHVLFTEAIALREANLRLRAFSRPESVRERV